MVGLENRPAQPVESPQHWLGRADPPVVGDGHLGSVLFEGPPAQSAHVTVSRQGKASDGDRLGDRQSPAKVVRQPALRVQVSHTADAVRSASLTHQDVEVDRWPPASQGFWITQDRRDLTAGAGDPPHRDELIAGAHRG